MMRVGRLTQSHDREVYRAVARLHASYIRHGLLSMLGHDFLTVLYVQLARTPRSAVWGAFANDRLIGFLAGTADIRRCYGHVFLRQPVSLMHSARRHLFNEEVLKRLPAVLAYPVKLATVLMKNADTDGQGTRAELLALAVEPGFQQQGIGRHLVTRFENALRRWGAKNRYRVATNIAESGSNAFYRSLDFEKSRVMRHHDLWLQVYEKEIE